VAVRKTSGSVGVHWRPWWVLLGVAWSAGACKSVGAAEQAASSEPTNPACEASLQEPQEFITYTVSCSGFEPQFDRVRPHGQLTFKSTCAAPVMITFSNPTGLFESGAEAIVLARLGDEKRETVASAGGCYRVCFDSKQCPPREHEPKTQRPLEAEWLLHQWVQ
jgi:hypothetical protein